MAKETKAVLITVEHPSTCLSCEEPVEFGAPAWWVPGVGVWHEECSRPRNIDTYARDAATKKRLGDSRA